VSDYFKDLFDIRVKPEGARRRPGERACEWPGCTDKGTFRAPKSPVNLTEHHWYCLDHVRAYNARWDFFEGMSPDQIETFQSTASTWHRPTWTLGSNPKGKKRGAKAGPGVEPPLGDQFDPRMLDPIGILDNGPTFRPQRRAEPPRPRRPELSSMIRDSLSALDLDEQAGLKDIKTRYKQLVKRYHPDANGGDNGAEDRLKRVIQAYRHLTTSGHFR
jgi:hypothetical protein